MVRTLDARSSQNGNGNVYYEALPTDPTIFGQVGLNIVNPVGIIRVQLVGSFVVSPISTLTGRTFIYVKLVRGYNYDDPRVYLSSWAIQIEDSFTNKNLSFSCCDYVTSAPPNNQLVYTLFVNATISSFVRKGPENLNAIAFCDE
ncbi:hypothetical protein [Paenibacillus sp. sgz500992]|uniref:hypothetical protein n=1 Tax=Paenibacillus sp. sgz500992 TaxID=3242476 RepID=UPI0036D36A35